MPCFKAQKLPYNLQHQIRWFRDVYRYLKIAIARQKIWGHPRSEILENKHEQLARFSCYENTIIVYDLTFLDS